MSLDQRPKSNGEDSEAVTIGAGRGLEDASNSASSQVQEQAQQAAALRFRPSSRDVISGFAPHLFDEPRPLRRRGSRSRRRRQTSSTECLRRSASPALHTSPLRLRVSLDEHGAIIPIVKVTPALISSNQNNTPHRQISRFRIDRVLRYVDSRSISNEFRNHRLACQHPINVTVPSLPNLVPRDLPCSFLHDVHLFHAPGHYSFRVRAISTCICIRNAACTFDSHGALLSFAVDQRFVSRQTRHACASLRQRTCK
ncbi:hypothetical protein B0H19DRAFT_1161222 [Mycena capillaripes]|nr:hypothetical protein B0H19DRAFT_1161222 [Mycena capillaripes]